MESVLFEARSVRERVRHIYAAAAAADYGDALRPARFCKGLVASSVAAGQHHTAQRGESAACHYLLVSTISVSLPTDCCDELQKKRLIDWTAHKQEGVLPAVVAVALSPSFLPHVVVVDRGRHIPT